MGILDSNRHERPVQQGIDRRIDKVIVIHHSNNLAFSGIIPKIELLNLIRCAYRGNFCL